MTSELSSVQVAGSPGFLPAASGRMTVCMVITGTSLGSPSVARKSVCHRRNQPCGSKSVIDKCSS